MCTLQLDMVRFYNPVDDLFIPVHNVKFVKYDVTVSFNDAVSDTIRRRGGDRGIFWGKSRI